MHVPVVNKNKDSNATDTISALFQAWGWKNPEHRTELFP
jgi:hypothetical protein